MLRITVMVSGGGTNLQAIIDGIENDKIQDAKIVQVISSTSKAFALERAKKHNIKGIVIGKENYPDNKEKTAAILEALNNEMTDLVVLAGYMSILDPSLIEAYLGRIINIHPSLIPAFCGHGFYGKHVHEAVLAAGAAKTGATVHFVDEGVDTGAIILQQEVDVLKDDTADTLAARVLLTEHQILMEAINKVKATILADQGGK